MRQVLPQWCKDSSCGKEVMAMFQVSRSMWSFCISPAYRDEELPSCSQSNHLFSRSHLMLLEKMALLCLLVQLSSPLAQSVKQGLKNLLLPAGAPSFRCPKQGTVDFAHQNPIPENFSSEFKTAAIDTLSQQLPTPISSSLYCHPSSLLVRTLRKNYLTLIILLSTWRRPFCLFLPSLPFSC